MQKCNTDQGRNTRQRISVATVRFPRHGGSPIEARLRCSPDPMTKSDHSPELFTARQIRKVQRAKIMGNVQDHAKLAARIRALDMR